MPSQSPRWLRSWLLLCALGALVAIGLVFAQPSQEATTRLLGLSPARWALVGLLLAVAAGAAWLARSQAQLEALAQRVANKLTLLNVLIGLAGLVFVVALYVVFFSLQITDTFAQARLLRVLPLTAWVAWASAWALMCWPRLRRPSSWVGEGAVLRAAWPALLVIAAVVAVMLLTGLGLTPDRTGWDTPGAPVLNTQVLLAWCAAVLAASLAGWAARRFGWRPTRLDLLAALGIWLLAVVLWSAQPLRPTHFSPAPSAPNWEYYPNSDAATLDVAAQSLLVGNGLSHITEKPLYSVFLTGLHAIAGQEYAVVVNAQILFVALFPVALYFIAAQLQHRFSGLLLAVIIILREINTLVLSNRILVSHSKLLMTDLPAALGIAAFTWLVLHWLQHKPHSPRTALGVGAALGLLLLLRSQTLIFLPFLVLLALVRTLPNWRSFASWRARLPLAGALLLGFALAAVPWMLRNGLRTGEFGYSQPYQMLYMARQYNLTPEDNDPGFDVETTSVDDYVALGSANVRQFVLEHPAEVARFITAHFLHNEVASFLALPARFDFTERAVEFYNLRPYWPEREGQLWAECCSLSAYIDGTPYWAGWNGVLPPDLVWPLVLTIAFVALGIGAAWRKLGWLTLVPLGVHLLYSASTALARVSGWRLILPADWVILLFYCIGIGQLTLWAGRYLFGVVVRHVPAEPAAPAVSGWLTPRLLGAAALALLAGAFIPLAELVVPNRYADMDNAAAIQHLQSSPVLAASDFDPASFAAQPGAALYWGRALYPRYAWASTDGEGLPFNHLEFRLVGPEGHLLMALPGPVRAFPNAAEVIVLGCTSPEGFRAAAVVFMGGEAKDLLAADASSLNCAALP